MFSCQVNKLASRWSKRAMWELLCQQEEKVLTGKDPKWCQCCISKRRQLQVFFLLSALFFSPCSSLMGEKWKPVMLYDRSTLVRSSSITAWWETLESLCSLHVCVSLRCSMRARWQTGTESPLFYHYYHLFTNAITDWLTALCRLFFSLVTGC